MHALPRCLHACQAGPACLLAALLIVSSIGPDVPAAVAQDGGLLAPGRPFETSPLQGRSDGAEPGGWWNDCPYEDLRSMCRLHESFYDPKRGLYFSRERNGWRAEAMSRDLHRNPYRKPHRNPYRAPHERPTDPFRSPYGPSPGPGSGDPFSTSPYSRDPFSTSPYARDPFTTRPDYRDPFPSRPPDRDHDSRGWRQDGHDRSPGWRSPSGGGVYEYRPRDR